MFMPRVLVVGGGAIGGITAAQMSCDVVVLDANTEHVARLRHQGSSMSRTASNIPSGWTLSPTSTSSPVTSISR
jgi:ketopantoate reductase